jgi:hypothetical protein
MAKREGRDRWAASMNGSNDRNRKGIEFLICGSWNGGFQMKFEFE